MIKAIFKEPVSKVELHYFFSDESHSMNALIRNKCEINLLGIFKEICSVLGFKLQTETEAFAEGGLRERFVLRGKSAFQISFASAVFHYVLPLEVDIEKAVSEEDRADARQRIEKLRKDLKEFERDNSYKIDMENAENVFSRNLKIIKLKSNFYRQINGCEKVTKFAVHLLKPDNTSVGKTHVISRKQFSTYMLVADTLKPELDDNAVIEIVSPVLKTGSYKWKGIYLQTGRIISFAMKDEAFKNEVISQGMAFKNGTRISCSLESTRKMSELGEIVVTGYSVLAVTQKQDDQATVEMPTPRTVRKKKEPVIQQLDLFGF